MADFPAGKLLAAVAAAGIVGGLVAGGAVWAVRALQPAPADLHELLHRRVPLNAAERARLEVKEQAYAQKRAQIETRLKAANGRLAVAIAADPRWSPEVEAGTRQVEVAAGDLERATLVHVFEMREGLDPAHRPTYDAALVEALQRGAR